MRFHNRLVDVLGVPFEEARRLTRWHFQWVVVHDFLPRVVGSGMVGQVLEERGDRPAKVRLDFFKPKNPNQPMLPVEFAAAAYRFGHSMIRRRYTMSKVGSTTTRALIFGADPDDPTLDPVFPNLGGSRPIPPKLVAQWSNLFEVDGGLNRSGGPRPARKIDSSLSFPLANLPASALASAPQVGSLAERNLLRGKRLGLPSGQRVAAEIGAPGLTNTQLDPDRRLGLGAPGWGGEAPLWFYILKEAELLHAGEQLGPVGGRIVAEVLLGLLVRDKNSYLSTDPGFRPTPPIAPAPGQFTTADLLKFAGVA